MKIATYSVIIVEIISIMDDAKPLPMGIRAAGLVIGILGVVVFALSVFTMKDSWRAGIAENDDTAFPLDGWNRVG